MQLDTTNNAKYNEDLIPDFKTNTKTEDLETNTKTRWQHNTALAPVQWYAIVDN